MNQKLLESFCATDPMRSDWQAPFVAGEWCYATDGHVAVRVPADDHQQGSPDAPRDTAMWLFETAIADATGDGFPLPTIPEPVYAACHECNGTGQFVYVCRECKNTGRTICDECDQERDCPKCDGVKSDGKPEACEGCDGTGKRIVRADLNIDGVYYDQALLRRFAGLANVRIWPRAHAPASVRFNGGEGVIMPLRAPFGARSRGR